MGEKEVVTKEGANEDCCVGDWEKGGKEKMDGEEQPSSLQYSEP